MSKMWLQLGCFLTGYNYELIRHSSVASAKSVAKYTSAILLVCMVWAFVGFFFTKRYLDGGLLGSIAGAIIMVVAVIQIERQIILTFEGHRRIIRLRLGLAFVMAILGAIIIDQLMFKGDIEKKKISTVINEVNELMPKRTAQLDTQIRKLDTVISSKELQRSVLAADLAKNPTINVYNTSSQYTKDSTGKQRLTGQNVEVSSIPNPKFDQLVLLDTQINTMRREMISREKKKLNLQEELEDEINNKKGFLDELKIFFSLFSSWIVVFVWLLFFLFFLFIEMLVAISKLSDKKNDYEAMLLHQMKIRIEQLKALDNAPE